MKIKTENTGWYTGSLLRFNKKENQMQKVTDEILGLATVNK